MKKQTKFTNTTKTELMVEIKFLKLDKYAQLPYKATADAACFDFIANRIELSEDGRTAIVYLGLACEFPKEYVMTLQPRSSFNHKGWEMSNSPGQIDADYRGELQVRFQAVPNGLNQRFIDFTIDNGNDYPVGEEFDYPEFPYKVGDRVAQGKIEHVIPTKIMEVDELSDTSRGTGGFGSTGK